MITRHRFRINILTVAALALLAVLPLLTFRAIAHGQASQPAPVVLSVPVAPPVATVQSAAPTALQALLDTLIKLVGIAATTVITILLKRWLGTKVNSEVLGQVTELAGQGVAMAEEAGHQRIGAGKSKLSPTEKSEIATTYVTETASKLGLSLVAAIAPAALKSMTDAQVSATRPQVAP